MSTIRPEFHGSLLSQVFNDIVSQRSNYFYFLGKVEPWANESAPPVSPNDTELDDVQIRDGMVYLKKVNAIDVSPVTTSYSWESGTVFTQWDHTQVMKGQPFYCVTDDYNVYKCLDNNNGAPSTIKPAGTSLTPTRLADGYLWKYMYNIPAFKRTKFLSRNRMPVQKALTDSFYNKGAVEEVNVINGGSGYTDVQMTSIVIADTTGSGAVLIPSISRETGEITKVNIISGGENYTNPELSLLQYPETGTGKYGNATAILKAVVFNGEIVNVTIEDPGVDYPADTETTIVVQGDGTGAQFTPVIYNGSIVDVIVDNPGINYSYIDLEVVGVGTGAVLEGVLATSDFVSDQSLVEQTAIKGAIHNVKVTNGGTNYSSSTTVQITGDGVGATAVAEIAGGAIQKVTITSPGSGYTRATITFVDPARPTPNNFVTAQAYAILPPIMGHGFDAVKELYADTLLVFTLIREDRELILLEQDYRQFGLIENPLELITNRRITTPTNFVTIIVTVADPTGLVPDAIVVSNNKRYRVVDVDGSRVYLQQLSSIFAQPSGTLTLEDSPFTQYTVSRIDFVTNVNKYSGNLLYVTNNPSFATSEDQAIAIRTYIKL